MAKIYAAKIEEGEAWITSHGLTGYRGTMLEEYCKELSIEGK